MESNPPLRLLAAFQQEFNKTPQWLLQMDEREMWIAAEITGASAYTVIIPDIKVRVRFDRSSVRRNQTTRKRPLPSSVRYVAGSVGILARMGLDMPGATIVIAGDEPKGPRYDYSLGMAFAALWHEYNEQEYTTQLLLDIMDEIQKESEDDD